MTVSLGIYASILKYGNVNMYDAIYNQKKKAFKTNIQNKKQATAIQVTFILEIKLQK